MTKQAYLLALAPLFGGLQEPDSAPPGAAVQWLDEAREALGRSAWDPQFDLCLTGQGTLEGVSGPLMANYAHDGRYGLSFDGELTRRTRFDGETLWLAEYSTLWYELELFDREVEQLRGLVHAGAWLDPQLGMVFRPAEGWQVPAGRVGFDMRLADGLLWGRVELDAYDFLVRRLTVPTGNGVLRADYEDYRSVGDMLLAHHVRFDLAVGMEASFEVSDARWAASDGARFARVEDQLDYTFDLEEPAEVEMLRSKSKHLFIRALINGKDLGYFLFDTGAGFSGISREAADELGLDTFGESSLTGLGGGVTLTGLRRAEYVQIGPLIIEDLVFSEIGVESKSKMLGKKVAGVFGWDIMQRAIVDLEPRGKLRLYDPATFELSKLLPKAQWNPMHVHYKVPFIKGKFPGDGEGLFMLDCGAAGSTVMFFNQAVKALGLMDGPEDPGPTSVSHGAGGRFSRRLSHMDWFEMAGEHMPDMPIVLSMGPDGESDPYTLGLVGGGLLRLYRLVFNMRGKQVAIVPL